MKDEKEMKDEEMNKVIIKQPKWKHKNHIKNAIKKRKKERNTESNKNYISEKKKKIYEKLLKKNCPEKDSHLLKTAKGIHTQGKYFPFISVFFSLNTVKIYIHNW